MSTVPEATMSTVPKVTMSTVPKLILVIGDFHIPHRKYSLSRVFKETLVPGKINHIFCTGNLTDKSTYEFLQKICPDVKVVKGAFDEEDYPSNEIVEFDNLKIGLINGYELACSCDIEELASKQREMGVDLLIFGNTHSFIFYRYAGATFLNPGSATGAYTNLIDDPVPSFVLLEVTGNTMSVLLYKEVDGKEQISRSEPIKLK